MCVKESQEITNAVTTSQNAALAALDEALKTKDLEKISLKLITSSFDINTDFKKTYCRGFDSTLTDCPETVPAISNANMGSSNQVYSFELNGVKKFFIIDYIPNMGCHPTMPQFVKDKDGEIYQLNAKPQPKTQKAIVVCGCHFECGGAAQPAGESVIYEIPASTQYKGAIDVSYTYDEVTLQYDQLEHSGAQTEKCTPPS